MSHSVVAEALSCLGMTATHATHNDEFFYLKFDDGRDVTFRHYQECCESVNLEQVDGDVNDLVGSPLVMAEKTSSKTEHACGDEGVTFYKFATVKGYVTLRFVGSSNGYYSVGVSEVWSDELR